MTIIDELKIELARDDIILAGFGLRQEDVVELREMNLPADTLGGQVVRRLKDDDSNFIDAVDAEWILDAAMGIAERGVEPGTAAAIAEFASKASRAIMSGE